MHYLGIQYLHLATLICLRKTNKNHFTLSPFTLHLCYNDNASGLNTWLFSMQLKTIEGVLKLKTIEGVVHPKMKIQDRLSYNESQ